MLVAVLVLVPVLVPVLLVLQGAGDAGGGLMELLSRERAPAGSGCPPAAQHALHALPPQQPPPPRQLQQRQPATAHLQPGPPRRPAWQPLLPLPPAKLPRAPPPAAQPQPQLPRLPPLPLQRPPRPRWLPVPEPLRPLLQPLPWQFLALALALHLHLHLQPLGLRPPPAQECPLPQLQAGPLLRMRADWAAAAPAPTRSTAPTGSCLHGGGRPAAASW